MAYPTTINFQSTDSRLGVPAINANNATQTVALGTTAKATDANYGEGIFVYLAGVASTVAGSLVIYDQKAGTTTLTVAASRGPVAVAMAPTVAGQFGWYQVSGAGVVSTTAAGTGAANALLAVTSTAGQGTVSGSAGVKIDSLVCKTTQDAPGTGFTGVQMDWPSANGNT
jgi:hypothetical protein